MGVKSNSSEEEVVKGRKLFTGIGDFKIIMVNPTLEELHEREIMLQSEPQYEVTFQNDDKPDVTCTKIVLWAQNDDVTVPVEFLITPGPWKSSTGKFKWYNRMGQDTWGNMAEDGSLDFDSLHEKAQEFFKEPETAYRIPKGMDTLTDFVRSWANVATDDDIYLDTIPALEKGDVAELREMIKDLSGNRVRLLCYVRDGKYQAVYTGHFGRMKPRRDDLFTSAIADNPPYSDVKGEYTLNWQPYEPQPAQPDSLGTEASDDDYLQDEEFAEDPLGEDPLG